MQAFVNNACPVKMSLFGAMVVVFATLVFAGEPKLTPAPHGPFHVEGRSIIDAAGRPFLIRGTQLPGLDFHAPGYFGPHSATTLITIRQRWNMNAVRLPASIAGFDGDPAYLASLGDVVRRANSLELLVILAVTEPEATHFWERKSGKHGRERAADMEQSKSARA